MADGVHFEKDVKCDISAAVQPILMKFCTMMHISLPKLMGKRKFNICKSKMADSGYLEN